MKRATARRLALALLLALWSAAAWWAGERLLGHRGRDRSSPSAAPRSPPAAAPLAELQPERIAAPSAAAELAAADDAAEAGATASAPRALVRGSVRRPRDGRPVRAGSVVVSHVDFALQRLTPERFAALDEAERVELHSFEEAALDGDGRFALAVPWPGVVRHAVVRPDLSAGNREPQFLETDCPLDERRLTLDAPLELDLVVDDGAAIEGIVVDAEGGFPLADARVMAPWWNDSASDWSSVSDREGRFRIVGIRREVAATDSWSELLVEREGYVTARFAAPPEAEEGDDDLDLEALRLPLARGVVVEVVLLPPTALDREALREWQAELERADLSLRPRLVDATGPVACVPWIARPRHVEAEGAARRVTFAPIEATPDVELCLSLRDGRSVPPIHLDASAARTAAAFPIELPGAASPRPPLSANAALDLRLLRADGRPLPSIDCAVEELRLERLERHTARTSVDAIAGILRPFPGRTLSLRVAGFATVHVTGIDERRFDGPLELRLVPLPSAR